MRVILAALTVGLLSFNAFADGDNITGLKGVMADMGNQMGVIAGALLKNVPTDQATLKAAADSLVSDVSDAQNRLPTHLVDGQGSPLASQTTAIQQYQSAMAQLLTAVTSLDNAIAAGDLATAKTVLTNNVLPLRQSGHDQFRQ